MSESQFPGEGIVWRGWNDETLELIQQKGLPVLLFAVDPRAAVWPFLKAVFQAMPANAKLRGLLHERYPAIRCTARRPRWWPRSRGSWSGSMRYGAIEPL